jgi:DHA2 family multidrug resistance protein
MGHYQLFGRERNHPADLSLARRAFGTAYYFLLSIAIFTISSGLCGMATNLGQLIFFRIMQGLAGGGLQPSRRFCWIAFPHGAAETLFGVAALLADALASRLDPWAA